VNHRHRMVNLEYFRVMIDDNGEKKVIYLVKQAEECGSVLFPINTVEALRSSFHVLRPSFDRPAGQAFGILRQARKASTRWGRQGLECCMNVREWKELRKSVIWKYDGASKGE